jgi:hypothetical protein
MRVCAPKSAWSALDDCLSSRSRDGAQVGSGPTARGGSRTASSAHPGESRPDGERRPTRRWLGVDRKDLLRVQCCAGGRGPARHEVADRVCSTVVGLGDPRRVKAECRGAARAVPEPYVHGDKTQYNVLTRCFSDQVGLLAGTR